MQGRKPGLVLLGMCVLLVASGCCKNASSDRRPIVDPIGGNPPVIIHGGSFHVAVGSTSKTETKSGNYVVVPVAKGATATINANAYGVAPKSLNGVWTVKVCTDSSCAHGVAVCSWKQGDTSCASGNGTPDAVAFWSIASGGSLTSLPQLQQYAGQFHHRFKAAGSTDSFPAVLVDPSGTSHPCPNSAEDCYVGFGGTN